MLDVLALGQPAPQHPTCKPRLYVRAYNVEWFSICGTGELAKELVNFLASWLAFARCIFTAVHNTGADYAHLLAVLRFRPAHSNPFM